MAKVKINIANKVMDYIDPTSGEKMTYEEFQRKYSKGGRGVLGKTRGNTQQEKRES